jgi:hypothetical protein
MGFEVWKARHRFESGGGGNIKFTSVTGIWTHKMAKMTFSLIFLLDNPPFIRKMGTTV